jgi:hypothetical protein
MRISKTESFISEHLLLITAHKKLCDIFLRAAAHLDETFLMHARLYGQIPLLKGQVGKWERPTPGSRRVRGFSLFSARFRAQTAQAHSLAKIPEAWPKRDAAAQVGCVSAGFGGASRVDVLL